MKHFPGGIERQSVRPSVAIWRSMPSAAASLPRSLRDSDSSLFVQFSSQYGGFIIDGSKTRGPRRFSAYCRLKVELQFQHKVSGTNAGTAGRAESRSRVRSPEEILRVCLGDEGRKQQLFRESSSSSSFSRLLEWL